MELMGAGATICKPTMGERLPRCDPELAVRVRHYAARPRRVEQHPDLAEQVSSGVRRNHAPRGEPVLSTVPMNESGS